MTVDIDGCTFFAVSDIEIVDTLSASVSGDTTICQGEMATLTATGGTSFAWSPGVGLSDSLVANPVASPTSLTTYTVVVSNNGACPTSRSVSVDVLLATFPRVWTGAIDNDWDNHGNWSCGGVPNDTTDVLIPDVSGLGNYPCIVMPGSIGECRSIYLQPNALLNVKPAAELKVLGP